MSTEEPGSGAEEPRQQEDDDASGGRRSRKRAPRARLLARVLGLVCLGIALAIFQFTQTSTGRNAAMSLLQRALAGAVDGELRIGPVLGGNLLTRITLSRLEVRTHDAELIVALDTVTLEYDPLALLRRQVRIRRLDAQGLDLRLEQGVDGRWNYERVFRLAGGADPGAEGAPPDTAAPADSAAAGGEGGAPFRLLIADAHLESGRFQLTIPWTESLEGAEREETIERIRAGEAIWAVRETPDGEYRRSVRVEELSGSFPRIRLVDPPRPFLLQLEGVSGRLHAVSRPLEVEEMTGVATFADSIDIELDRLRTPGSSVTGSGWVRADDPLSYAFRLVADPISFEDLQWLPLPIPESGGGPMEIDLASQGDDLVVTVMDGDVRSEDTHLSGGFRVRASELPVFEEIDLRLDPLRLAWLDRVLDRESGMDGWIRGTVRGSGPIDDLRIDADVSLEPHEPGVAPSDLVARGRLGLVEPYLIRGLELDLASFQLEWVRVLGFEPPLDGRVRGQVTLDRPTATRFALEGDLSHGTPTGELSRLSGSGSFDLVDPLRMDVTVEARPLALSLVEERIEDVDLVGSVSGSFRARGDLGDLEVTADLQSERGRLAVEGTFDLASEVPTYDASFEASDLSLDQWLEDAPDSRLAVRGRVAGRGVEPATLDTDFDLEILSSTVERAEIFPSQIRFHLADGLAAIDTFAIDSDVGAVSGRGRFGLTEDREGTLEFEVTLGDLSALDRWFAEDIPGGVEAEAGEPLFESFEAALAAEPEEEATEGLDGRLTARGVVVGRLEDYTVEAFVEASRPRFEGYRADTLSARFQLLEPPGVERIVAEAMARQVDLGELHLDSLFLRVERSEPGAIAVDLHARRDTTLELAVRGGVRTGEAWSADLEWLRVRIGNLESELVAPARLAYSDSALVADDFEISGPLGRLVVDGRVPAAGEGDLRIELFGVRVEQLGYLTSNALEVGGTLGGEGRVTGSLSAPRIDATLTIDDPAIRDQSYSGVDARVAYADERIEGTIDLMGRGQRLARLTGSVLADLALEPVEGRLREDPIDLTLRGDSIPLALLELRVRGLQDISGVADAEMTLQGAPRDLRYGGSIQIVGGRAWVPDLGVWMADAGARATFRGSVARVDSAYVASSAGGFLRAEGTVDIASLADPRFDLEIDASRFHAVSRADMSLAVEGTGQLTGQYTAPRLTGDFRLRGGDIRQDELLRARQVIDLSDPTIYALLDSASVTERRLLESFRNPFMDNLVVDASVSLGPNLWLRSPELDVELVAEGLDVLMDRGAERTVVTGVVRLPRGTYRFDRLPPYVQSLRITGGTIQFVGNPDLNPNLDIAAEYRDRTGEGPVVVTARIGGTLARSTLALSSSPPMSENDQLCFLTVGAPCFRSADAQLGQRLLQETFLGTVSSGISSALVGSSGLSYFSLRSIGEGSSDAAGAIGLFEQTAVEFGWYAGEDIFFTFSQPLGGGLPRATLEWTFSENWTLEARASSRFDDRLFGVARNTNLGNEQTFGLFLFREWGF